MTRLIEYQSRKAARILDSTRELVLDHGVRKVTVTEIAREAGVGKGTVYLYWPTKEDLILGLFARDLLTFLDEAIACVVADPATVLPRRFGPLLIRTGLKLPLARRLYRSEADLLRLFTQQAGYGELLARTTPNAMCEAGMPILHRHHLIRRDRPLQDLTYMVHAVTTGFLTAIADPAGAPPGPTDPDVVLADTLAQLLDPPAAPAASAIAAAAAETVAVMREIREAVLELIDRSQTPGSDS
ncbi:TetR/AcrR family transcriptional regulator [Spongiactinospora gelatinilytica]|uniref:TetR/AcrR family transcriptional regulator n=1 Tax=Spongiactinospora gelatinilytica TaxID=2666298 RepID=A0A2W2GYR6_9ACTN|nr:helix-turn-helix domain-containing protein [Spongiactinospora gelatinilytica]PZG32034.1 TetR/AcrR family transcriptional regulator [Spongiactinospora gelatinilytica]